MTACEDELLLVLFGAKTPVRVVSHFCRDDLLCVESRVPDAKRSISKDELLSVEFGVPDAS